MTKLNKNYGVIPENVFGLGSICQMHVDFGCLMCWKFAYFGLVDGGLLWSCRQWEESAWLWSCRQREELLNYKENITTN